MGDILFGVGKTVKVFEGSGVVSEFVAFSGFSVEADCGFTIALREILGGDSGISEAFERGEFFGAFEEIGRVELLLGHVHHDFSE